VQGFEEGLGREMSLYLCMLGQARQKFSSAGTRCPVARLYLGWLVVVMGCQVTPNLLNASVSMVVGQLMFFCGFFVIRVLLCCCFHGLHSLQHRGCWGMGLVHQVCSEAFTYV
jgi:hypothetical protein